MPHRNTGSRAATALRAFWGYKLVVPHLTSACQSRLLSPFKVLPPVCRVFRVPWRCLRRKRMIAFIQTAYVAEDLAVLKFPDWERDVERSSKAVRGEHSPSPERLAKERTVWLRMKRGRHSAQEPFRGMPENVCRRVVSSFRRDGIKTWQCRRVRRYV